MRSCMHYCKHITHWLRTLRLRALSWLKPFFWNAVTQDASLSLIYTSRASDVRYIQLIGWCDSNDNREKQRERIEGCYRSWQTVFFEAGYAWVGGLSWYLLGLVGEGRTFARREGLVAMAGEAHYYSWDPRRWPESSLTSPQNTSPVPWITAAPLRAKYAAYA